MVWRGGCPVSSVNRIRPRSSPSTTLSSAPRSSASEGAFLDFRDFLAFILRWLITLRLVGRRRKFQNNGKGAFPGRTNSAVHGKHKWRGWTLHEMKPGEYR